MVTIASLALDKGNITKIKLRDSTSWQSITKGLLLLLFLLVWEKIHMQPWLVLAEGQISPILKVTGQRALQAPCN